MSRQKLKWVWVISRRIVGLVALIAVLLPLFETANSWGVDTAVTGAMAVIAIMLLAVMWAVSGKVWENFVIFVLLVLMRFVLDPNRAVSSVQHRWAWLDMLVVGLCLIGTLSYLLYGKWKKLRDRFAVANTTSAP
jgi:hypothetical protein